MTLYFALKFLHVIGAAVLLGTGAGIAFFMLMAHRSGNPHVIAGVARIVVIADFLFTATAVVLQPLTGLGLVHISGYPLGEGWIVLSILLYLVTGAFWLPVVFFQMRMRDLATAAARAAEPLPRLITVCTGLVRIRFPGIRGGAGDFLADDNAPDDTAADALISGSAQRTSCARNCSSLRYWSARDMPSRATAGTAGMPAGRCAIQRRSCSAMIEGSLATIPVSRSRII